MTTCYAVHGGDLLAHSTRGVQTMTKKQVLNRIQETIAQCKLERDLCELRRESDRVDFLDGCLYGYKFAISLLTQKG